MLTRIKLLLLDKAIFIAIFITLVIGVLSLIKINLEKIPVSSPDKIGHILAYFFLALFWLLSALKKQDFKRYARYAVLGCFIYGMVLELVQSELTSYRTGSYLDMVANSTGILLAILTFYLLDKKNRLI